MGDGGFMWVGLGLAFAIGLLAGRWIRSQNTQSSAGDASHSTDTGSVVERPTRPEAPPRLDLDSLYAIADALEPIANRGAQPQELFVEPLFQDGALLLAECGLSTERLVDYCFGGNWIIGIMAADALTRRDDAHEVADRVLGNIGDAPQYPLFFRLRLLQEKGQGPLIGPVLAAMHESWTDMPMTMRFVEEFVRARLAAGEQLVFGAALDDCYTERLNEVWEFIKALPEDLATPLHRDMQDKRVHRVDYSILNRVGRLWKTSLPREPFIRNDRIDAYLQAMREAFAQSPPRSLLLVGESGVGKTVLRRAFSDDLIRQGWQVLETTAPHIIAGQKYMGELQKQVKELAENVTVAKRFGLWVERLHELASYGQHSKSDESILDELWPYLASHEVFLTTEATPQVYQRLSRKYPDLPVVFKVIRVKPPDDAQATILAEAFLERLQPKQNAAKRRALAADARQLAGQYFSHKALPGRDLALLGLAQQRAGREKRSATRDDVLASLGELTGLPGDVLDERQSLDLTALRQAFERRIVGQGEAVDCLVERIAMLKAGLTDPKRPLGVFLFAGPTGTGKTEIAKTLTEILFGAESQMIRLDMSEYQSQDATERLLDPGVSSAEVGSLVNLVRKQPFSVILLDEFEKAHPAVWDIFLQVFDDGRLTDLRGGLADFRHTLIVLTSNLGATISSEAGIGFTSQAGVITPQDVMRAVNQSFRREFLNRLDRVIVFRPLSRDVMRNILKKELQLALTRRGLRSKSWAVEWEDSAIEFLLERGFTADLGARPLRRAIEHHILAPLSMAMVEHRAPEGEQFLFVRSDGNDIQVEFVDPDAEDEEALRLADLEAPESDVTVKSILLHQRGTQQELALLANEYRTIETRLNAEEWTDSKATAIAEINAPDFWERSDRDVVLDRVELMDRIESAAQVVSSLTHRLERGASGARLVKEIAAKLYVLQEGLADYDQRRPTVALVALRPVSGNAGSAPAAGFLEQLENMYVQWAKRRRMHLRRLDTGNSTGALLAVGGFGSYGILEREAGLHVFEVPRDKHRFDRIRVRVAVAPAPALAGLAGKAAAKAAHQALGTAELSNIVRRYRAEPSPLVRDDVSGWRTGRLETVLGGDFDLL